MCYAVHVDVTSFPWGTPTDGFCELRFAPPTVGILPPQCPWVTPTVGILPPLCPWVVTHGWGPATANAVQLVVLRFPWVITHGWGPITATRFMWDLPLLCGSIGRFALFRHQFEEHGGAVFKCRGINGYGGFAVAFDKRKLLASCAIEAESV